MKWDALILGLLDNINSTNSLHWIVYIICAEFCFPNPIRLLKVNLIFNSSSSLSLSLSFPLNDFPPLFIHSIKLLTISIEWFDDWLKINKQFLFFFLSPFLFNKNSSLIQVEFSKLVFSSKSCWLWKSQVNIENWLHNNLWLERQMRIYRNRNWKQTIVLL